MDGSDLSLRVGPEANSEGPRPECTDVSTYFQGPLKINLKLFGI